MKFIEGLLETFMFNSRWLLAPFYLALVLSIGVLLVKFAQEFLHIAIHMMDVTESEVVLGILTLVDMSLVANLLIIIIFSGYENFVSKIDTAGHEDRPDWMGKVDFSGLKVKLIASIVAISAIELLKDFMNVRTMGPLTDAAAWTNGDKQLAWKVGIHAMLVISGVMFAVMDRIAGGGHGHAGGAGNDAAEDKGAHH